MDNNVTHHKLRIFTHGGVAHVEPGHLVVQPNDTFEFIAIDTNATFFFPTPGVIEPAIDGATDQFCRLTKDAAKNDTRYIFTVVSTTKGVYPYAVFCEETNDFAEGHSTPMMIIDDVRP